jgi:hypothetical protein
MRNKTRITRFFRASKSEEHPMQSIQLPKLSEGTHVPAGRSYDFREDGDGWCVFDSRSGRVVSLKGRQQTGLGLYEADELAAALSRAAVLPGAGI